MFPLRSLLFVLPALSVAAALPTDLIYGHHEVQVDYTATPGNPNAGWAFSVSYNPGGDFSNGNTTVRLDPSAAVLLAAPSTRATVPSPAGLFSRFGPPGTPLWILPQNNVLGGLFLGVRAILPAGVFQARVGNNYSPDPQGSISLRLVSVAGTGPDAGGHFATWKTEAFGSTVFSFDTTDGIGAADEIPTVPAGAHTHYNWALTKPGLYRVTLEAKGKLNPAHGNTLTSAQQTFTFAVPFSGRVTDGGALKLSGAGSGAPRLLATDLPNSVAYAPDRAMIEATTAAGPASSGLAGAMWQFTGSLQTAPGSIANGVGVPAATAAGGLSGAEWSDVALEVVSVRGPGNFALLDGGGGVLATGAGGTLPLIAGTDQPVAAAFTATGLYRVTFITRGERHGLAAEGEPVTLTFGAGLGADHDYAAWRSSFERTAGLPAGALADPGGDHDGDGVANGFEFALFWQGLDPTVADAHRMPRATLSGSGDGVFAFFRDTYKDPLDESGWQLRPAASADLQTWQLRSSRVPGFPLDLYETGAEEGNAYGRILHRRLRWPGVDRVFFRFDLQPAP